METGIEKLMELKDTFKGNTYGFDKYFKYEKCLKVKQKAYKTLKIPKNSAILDISSGFGYFPYICMLGGHTVTVTDVCVKKDELCTQARKALGIPKAIPFIYPDRKYVDLPEDIGTFDLITAFAVSPHSFFSKEDWTRYIEDCRKHLNTGGRIYIEPNRSEGMCNLFSMDEHNTKGVLI